MVHVGMDVHQASTTFCILDPPMEGPGRYRTLKRPTTAEAFREVLAPFRGRCKVVFGVGTQVQWVASIVRPLAAEVQVANPSRVPWVFRDGGRKDRYKKAVVATGRKVPSIAYGMMRTGLPFDPARVSAPAA